MRRCAWCTKPIPARARPDARFCSVLCRQRSHRFNQAIEAAVTATNPMRFGYADPPYPGKAHYYAERREVDHRELVARLVCDFPDGWALSTSAEALRDVLALCPPAARVCAWFRGVRGRASSRRTTIRPTRAKRALSAWEPLIVVGGRRPLPSDACQKLEDGLIAQGRFISHPGALIGMKPPAFAEWMFRQLGAGAGDELVDLFPGSGAIGRAWKHYTDASRKYSGDASQLEHGDAPAFEHQGIGQYHGPCWCSICRYIITGQVRAALELAPPERRAELLAALDESLVDEGDVSCAS